MNNLLRGTLLFALVGALGCPEAPNSLEGSISDTFDLTFDRTELRRFTSGAIQLDYLQDVEGSDQPAVICKVVFNSPEDGIVAGEEIPIVPPEGIIERRAGNGEDFPDIDTASITFDSGGNEAGPAAGRFVSTFTTGKTLNGNFDVDMEIVDF